MRRMMTALAAVLMAVTGVVALASSPVPAAPAPTTDLKISEFRLRGPNGANDEFIEITNVGPPHTVAATSGAGYALVASDGITRCVIPDGTVIPTGGHFLCVNSVGYSLASYPSGPGTTATGDATFSTDIPDNSGLALFASSTSADFTIAQRIDAVGHTTTADTLYKEGVGIPSLTPFSIDYSFYRNLTTGSVPDTEITNPTPGLPQDTDDNAADFVFVDTNGTSAGAGQRLGAPGPENSSSPVARGGIEVNPVDDCVPEGAAPNAVRTTDSDPANNSTFGTVTYHRTITNTTDEPITRLRLRVADIRTFPAPSGFTDTRPRTSTSGTIDVNDPSCSGGTSTIPVSGTTFEQPPSQPNGGGFNSSWSVGTVTPATPLGPGESITVKLLSGLQQTGATAVRIVPEATTTAAYTVPVPVCLGTDQAGGRNACYPPAPIVTQDPGDESVIVGETATFTAAATGYETVRWESSPDDETWSTIAGADETTLAFTAALAMDGTFYRAVFVDDDEQETATASATLTVAQRSTSVDLTVDPETPIRGDDVTLTATVSPATATGTVQFAVDGTDVGDPVAVEDGVAVSAPIEDLPTGGRGATATYSGDAEHAGSTGTASFDVAAITTTVTVTADPTAATWGDEVTFTAELAPAAATGTVRFTVDGSDVGDPVAVVDGVAVSPPVTSLNVGSRVIAAIYSGDEDHATATGDTTVVVSKRSTTTELSADPAEPVVGEPVTVTATVGPETADGTVQFAVDGTAVGEPVALEDGVAVSAPITDLAVGDRVVTATYSGDKTHEGSDEGIFVTVARRTTTTTVTAVRPAEPVEGDTIELDVTVAPAGATGDVLLTLGDELVSEEGVPVDPETGTATVTMADAPAGELELTAVFFGDGDYESSSGDVTVTVITDDGAFVRRAYQVVLGRSADAGGVEYWTGVLRGGGSRERVTDSLARQTEGRRKLVQDAYVAVLNRPADSAGRDYWVGRLAAGLTPEDLVVQFAASPEARAGAGGTTEGLVGMLYRAHLGRDGDEAGVAYWVARIDAATTENARRTVARSFGRTSEVTTAAVRFATQAACGPHTPVPTDAAYGQSFASTGRDHLRLAGLVLARHCPVLVPVR